MATPLTRAIPNVEFKNAAWPFFVYSFGAYAFVIDIEALHINHGTLSSWLSTHNVSNKTCL